MKESGNKIAQLCPTLCDPMDCSLLGSPIHGIFWARVLEWVAISFSIWRKGKCISQSSPRKTEQVEHTHTHTHTHIYLFIQLCTELACTDCDLWLGPWTLRSTMKSLLSQGNLSSSLEAFQLLGSGAPRLLSIISSVNRL